VGDRARLPREIACLLDDSPAAVPAPIAIADLTLVGASSVSWEASEFSRNEIPLDETQQRITARTFSGTLIYEGTFTWEVHGDVQLELSELNHLAEVEINDRPVGAILWKPWTITIPQIMLNNGTNHLRLTVKNTLADYARSEAFTAAYTQAGVTPGGYWTMSACLDARVKGIGVQIRQPGEDVSR
jgi:hypothetical protein